MANHESQPNDSGEQLATPELVLYEYTDRVVAILDRAGTDFMDFPGTTSVLPPVEGSEQRRRLLMGVTEPYPAKSPRFGGALPNEITNEQHLIVTATEITHEDYVRMYEHVDTDKAVGYAVTNVRNSDERVLWYSEHPAGCRKGVWREITASDPQYATHAEKFIELTGLAVDGLAEELASQIAVTEQKASSIDSAITERQEKVDKYAAGSERKLKKGSKELNIEPDELDELHADQVRLVVLLDSLSRKQHITGEKIPRSKRVSRSDHKERVPKVRQTLETSYDISKETRKVPRVVIDRALADMSRLEALRVSRDKANKKVNQHNAQLDQARITAEDLRYTSEVKQNALKEIGNSGRND